MMLFMPGGIPSPILFHIFFYRSTVYLCFHCDNSLFFMFKDRQTSRNFANLKSESKQIKMFGFGENVHWKNDLKLEVLNKKKTLSK